MKSKYDVVIIGAGVSGLICGCYLAKNGMRTLIVEKNEKPGGYCTSVEKGGYKFDLGVHNLGNFGDGSMLNRIFTEIGVLNDLKIIKRDSAHTILMPDLEIELYSDYRHTLHSLKEKFPKEARGLDTFFNTLFKSSTHALYGAYKKESYQKVIDECFKDNKIKCLLRVLSGNNAVSSEHLSGFVALMMIKNFVFGGAYNIKNGGVQVLSDSLARKLLSFGGEIIYNAEVDRIEVKNKQAIGVDFKKNAIKSKYVISASDAYNTFTKLIDKRFVDKKIINKLDNLMTTSSALLCFFGLRPKSLKFSRKRHSFWYCPTHRSDLYFSDSSDIKRKPIFFYSPTQYDNTLTKNRGDILTAAIIADYNDKLFWDDKMEEIRSYVVGCANKIFGISSEDIVVEDHRTPRDLYVMTKNYKGAVRGWASTPRQSSRDVFSGENIYKNLFCTGHWTTAEFGQGGISNVANMARRTYESILREESR